MAYYILAKYVNAGMKIDSLPPEFFEYIFMDKGDAASAAAITGIPEKTVRQIHDDFAYWYPVDIRTFGQGSGGQSPPILPLSPCGGLPGEVSGPKPLR